MLERTRAAAAAAAMCRARGAPVGTSFPVDVAPHQAISFNVQSAVIDCGGRRRRGTADSGCSPGNSKTALPSLSLLPPLQPPVPSARTHSKHVQSLPTQHTHTHIYTRRPTRSSSPQTAETRQDDRKEDVFEKNVKRRGGPVSFPFLCALRAWRPGGRPRERLMTGLVALRPPPRTATVAGDEFLSLPLVFVVTRWRESRPPSLSVRAPRQHAVGRDASAVGTSLLRALARARACTQGGRRAPTQK